MDVRSPKNNQCWTWTIPNTEVSYLWDPHVTIAFNKKSWSYMTTGWFGEPVIKIVLNFPWISHWISIDSMKSHEMIHEFSHQTSIETFLQSHHPFGRSPQPWHRDAVAASSSSWRSCLSSWRWGTLICVVILWEQKSKQKIGYKRDGLWIFYHHSYAEMFGCFNGDNGIYNCIYTIAWIFHQTPRAI